MNAEPHELPENFTIESWADLADDLLCAGQSAKEIRVALVDVWPSYQWFVLVQDSSETWASSKDLSTDLHHADNLCGKNLMVWMYSGSVQPCNENIGGVTAQHLIDEAISHYPHPDGILDYIKSSMEKNMSNVF